MYFHQAHSVDHVITSLVSLLKCLLLILSITEKGVLKTLHYDLSIFTCNLVSFGLHMSRLFYQDLTSLNLLYLSGKRSLYYYVVILIIFENTFFLEDNFI